MNHRLWNCIQQWIRKYWWAIILLILVAVIPFVLKKYIRNNVLTGYEDTWVASEGSYWGGIVGGIISGILACVGVYVTIRYYKESDAKKERAAIMPFFNACEVEFNIDHDYVYLPSDIEKAQRGKMHYTIAIQNIGNGFAYVEDIHCRDDKSKSVVGKTITKEQRLHIYLLIKDNNLIDEIIDIHFCDSQGNDYIQSLHIYNENNGTKMIYQYPQLIKNGISFRR